jgi:4-hydroxybenzoate polyprenyltransferase
VRHWLSRIIPALHLTRVTSAFAAVANVWFVILWTRAAADEPGTAAIKGVRVVEGLLPEASSQVSGGVSLWLLLLGGAANALGLFAFATAMNDVLDWRRDRALNPNRPIPAGRFSIDQAVTLVACTLVVAVLGATVMGMTSVVLTLLVAGAILFFNATGKFIPAVGLVALGLIYAGQMVVPNLSLRFVWPVWLVMTHALAVGGMVHIVARKIPTVSTRAAVFAVAGWVFWSAVILAFGYFRGGVLDAQGHWSGGTLWPAWVRPWAWVWPTVLAVAFVLLAWRRVRALGMNPRAAEKLARYGALWLALYACAWLVGQHWWQEAAIVGSLPVAGFLGMTILREFFTLIEHPIRYRR